MRFTRPRKTELFTNFIGNQIGSRRDCVYLVLMYAAVISLHWFETKHAKLRRWLQTKHLFTIDIRMIIWQCTSSQVVIKNNNIHYILGKLPAKFGFY
jgi:uncharacterized membrane protein